MSNPISKNEILETVRECGKDEESRLQLLALITKLEKSLKPQDQQIIGILDDDKLLVRYLDSFLQSNNFKTLCATNAKAFLNLCESQKPSAILLDINMPDVDGGEIMKILQAEPRTSDIPIIFMSGIIDSAEEDELNRNSLNNIRYIAKPFDTDRIINEISKILHIREELSLENEEAEEITTVKLRVTRRVNSSGQLITSVNLLLDKIDELLAEFGYAREDIRPVVEMLLNSGKVYIEGSDFAERWELMKNQSFSAEDILDTLKEYA